MTKPKLNEWSGNSIEWFFMEILVYITYIASMMLLMIKSRIVDIGVD